MHICFLFYSSFCFGLVILVFGVSVCIFGAGWFKPLHIQVELDE